MFEHSSMRFPQKTEGFQVKMIQMGVLLRIIHKEANTTNYVQETAFWTTVLSTVTTLEDVLPITKKLADSSLGEWRGGSFRKEMATRRTFSTILVTMQPNDPKSHACEICILHQPVTKRSQDCMKKQRLTIEISCREKNKIRVPEKIAVTLAVFSYPIAVAARKTETWNFAVPSSSSALTCVTATWPSTPRPSAAVQVAMSFIRLSNWYRYRHESSLMMPVSKHKARMARGRETQQNGKQEEDARHRPK